MFNHTYLICSMEPEQYEYENNQGEDYSRDEWYYQNPNTLEKEEEDDFLTPFEDEEDEYDMQEEPDWFFGEDRDYEPNKEV